jgi:hypothetical protein
MDVDDGLFIFKKQRPRDEATVLLGYDYSYRREVMMNTKKTFSVLITVIYIFL